MDDELPEPTAVYSPSPSARLRGEKLADPTAAGTFVHYLPSDGTPELDNVTIGIVTILPYEHAAACHVFTCVGQRTGASTGTTYDLATIYGSQGDGIVVAIAVLNQAGTNQAATMVANMLNDCRHLREVIVCGIAGAIPVPQRAEDHVRLGDIVLSTEGVVQYDFGKRLGDQFLPTPRTYSASQRLVAAVRQLRSKEALGIRPWEKLIAAALQGLPPEFQRPDESLDVLCEPSDQEEPSKSDAACDSAEHEKQDGTNSRPPLAHPADSSRRPGCPRVFDGLVGSANSVLKSRNLREKLRTQYPRLRAVEMEGVGAAESCHARGDVGYFMVRGTVDYCNEYKNDVWHKYASIVAAAFTRALLEQTDVAVFSTPIKVLTKVKPPAARITLGTQFMDAAINHAEPVAGGQTSSGKGGANELLRLPASEMKDVPADSSTGVHIPEMQLRTTSGSPISEGAVDQVQSTPEAVEQQLSVPPDEASGRDQQLIVEDVESKCVELEDLLERWEFGTLFGAAASLVRWISSYEEVLPTESVSRVYILLARIEMTRATTAGGADKNALGLARQYLSKARDANNR